MVLADVIGGTILAILRAISLTLKSSFHDNSSDQLYFIKNTTKKYFLELTQKLSTNSMLRLTYFSIT